MKIGQEITIKEDLEELEVLIKERKENENKSL